MYVLITDQKNYIYIMLDKNQYNEKGKPHGYHEGYNSNGELCF